MKATALIQTLENSLDIFPLLIRNIAEEDMRWKPPSGNWSLLEIICHLGYEETHDFRARLKSILEDPKRTWPPIAPEQTVVDDAFNDRDVKESIESFVAERKASLQWLRGVLDGGEVDWNVTYQHPELGPFRAGDLLASWVAHDQLHVRQIAKRIYELTDRDAPDYSLKYAGDL